MIYYFPIIIPDQHLLYYSAVQMIATFLFTSESISGIIYVLMEKLSWKMMCFACFVCERLRCHFTTFSIYQAGTVCKEFGLWNKAVFTKTDFF